MDKSRKQFEEWFKKEYPLIESQPENTLLQSVKRQCHKAWQASRDKLEIELPTKEITEWDDLFKEGLAIGYNNSIDDYKEVLISNGVKIKNES